MFCGVRSITNRWLYWDWRVLCWL